MSGSFLNQLIQTKFTQKKTDPKLLDFSHYKIVKIGAIPTQLVAQVKSLNLSNNFLKNIEGIQKFSSLEFLNLTRNKISDADSLLVLKDIKSLKKVFLKGNPFLDNPLKQQILSFIGSFQNDLEILNFAFHDSERQSLIKQFRKQKSLAKISPLVSSKSQQSLKNFSQKVQATKSIQKSKVNILLTNLQEYIQEGRQSQQISSESMQIQNEHNKLIITRQNSHKNPLPVTPIRKSPKFGQTLHQRQYIALNESSKIQQESTKLKQRVRNISKPRDQTLVFEQNHSNTNRGDSTNSPQKRTQRSSDKQFKYQVSNLKINLVSDTPQLNYPSIIQREDQDSYEIQFDFMSPQSNKRSMASKGSPSSYVKEMEHDYIKIQEAHKTQQQQKQLQKTKRMVSNTQKYQQSYKQKNDSRQKDIFKRFNKQNSFKQINLSPSNNLNRKGSLYESTRSYVPQPTSSNTYQLINKHFNSVGDMSIIHQAPSQIIENGQKFERFYYNSLTRLKPAFNLLYSPFSSLKVEEKDLLLQQLFKNHKQIFMLLIREFHSREKLQQQVEAQNNLNQQISFQLETLHQEANQTFKKQNQMKILVQILKSENNNLKKQLVQFQEVLTSRQKLINDVQIQYQQVNKNYLKKEKLIEKYLNQDQIQERIIQNRQKILKKAYLQILLKKSNKISKIKQFQKINQKNRLKRDQIESIYIKRQVIEAFKQNFEKQRKLKHFIGIKNRQFLQNYFKEWKFQTKTAISTRKVQKLIKKANQNQFLEILSKNYLNKRRLIKVEQIYRLKLVGKIFYKGFRKSTVLSKTEGKENIQRAILYHNQNLKVKLFQLLKNSLHLIDSDLSIKSEKVLKAVIMKNSVALMKRILNNQKKEINKKTIQVQKQIVQISSRKRFFRIIKRNTARQLKNNMSLKLALKNKLSLTFQHLKKYVKFQHNQYQKLKKSIHKQAQQKRIKILITQFKKNQVKDRLDKLKTISFYDKLRQNLKISSVLNTKQQQLQNHLNFRRVFKLKTNFINFLRLQTYATRMQKRQKSLEQHYRLQQIKYRQSYELNILTIDQLKSQIQTYLNQIQFAKQQIQILSQRQQFILEEKEDCLLQINSKQQENLQLRTLIMQNQMRLEDLQKKYQKSLDMYAAAVQIAQKQAKIDKTYFLYDTIKPDIKSPSNIRRQNKQTNFTSLRR